MLFKQNIGMRPKGKCLSSPALPTIQKIYHFDRNMNQFTCPLDANTLKEMQAEDTFQAIGISDNGNYVIQMSYTKKKDTEIIDMVGNLRKQAKMTETFDKIFNA